MTSHHVAQLNVARLREPLDHPTLAPFVQALEIVNADADASPGFVWRLIDADGHDATDIRGPWGDDTIVNLTVWESFEALKAFYLSGRHLEIMRRRREFFDPYGAAYVVLWWIDAGHIPTLDEAKERLDHLDAHGPSAYAFSPRQAFPSPDEASAEPQR